MIYLDARDQLAGIAPPLRLAVACLSVNSRTGCQSAVGSSRLDTPRGVLQTPSLSNARLRRTDASSLRAPDKARRRGRSDLAGRGLLVQPCHGPCRPLVAVLSRHGAPAGRRPRVVPGLRVGARAAHLSGLRAGWLRAACVSSGAVSLLLELSMIRWQGSVWEFFAFYKNFG